MVVSIYSSAYRMISSAFLPRGSTMGPMTIRTMPGFS